MYSGIIWFRIAINNERFDVKLICSPVIRKTDSWKVDRYFIQILNFEWNLKILRWPNCTEIHKIRANLQNTFVLHSQMYWWDATVTLQSIIHFQILCERQILHSSPIFLFHVFTLQFTYSLPPSLSSLPMPTLQCNCIGVLRLKLCKRKVRYFSPISFPSFTTFPVRLSVFLIITG